MDDFLRCSAWQDTEPWGEATGVLSEASQQPEPYTDKADDMDETIQVMEQDAEESVEPVDTHVEQSTAQSSYQDDGDNE